MEDEYSWEGIRLGDSATLALPGVAAWPRPSCGFPGAAAPWTNCVGLREGMGIIVDLGGEAPLPSSPLCMKRLLCVVALYC
jgi:hypothetical protein